MTAGRRSLLWALLILMLTPLALAGAGGMGTVEVSIWLGLLLVWLFGFVVWAAKD